jgi:hypothetical protein
MVRRIGLSSRFNDNDEENKLGDLLSLYNAVKEEETKRDEEIKKTDFSIMLKTIETCMLIAEKNPKSLRRYLNLPNVNQMLMLMTKTQYTDNDRLKSSLENLIIEFYDEPIYTPLLKYYYIDLLISIISRVDLDAKERAKLLKSIENAGKTAGGAITGIQSDLKSYARTKFGENISEQPQNIDSNNEENLDKSVDSVLEDLEKQMDEI